MQNNLIKKIIITCFTLLTFSTATQADIFGLEEEPKPAPSTTEDSGPTIFDDVPHQQRQAPVQSQGSQTPQAKQAKVQVSYPPAIIESIPVSRVLQKLLASKGIVVLHISSDDTACRYCIDSNANFKSMVKRHPNKTHARFWQTGAMPYQNILNTAIAKQLNIKNLPMTVVFKDGQLNREWLGGTMHRDTYKWLLNEATQKPASTLLSRGTFLNRETFHPFPPVGSAPKGIETVNENLVSNRMREITKQHAPKPHELKGLSKSQKAQLIKSRRPLILLSLSSYDAGCPPCIKVNQEIDVLAKRYEGSVYFLRVMPRQWGNDFPFKHQYLIHRMPITMFFAGTSLLYSAEGARNADILERYVLHKSPDQPDSRYQVSNEPFQLPAKAHRRNEARITQINESENSSILLGSIQYSKGLMIVNVSDRFRHGFAPTYLKILLNKYAGRVKFIHTNRPEKHAYDPKLSALFDAKHMPHVLLFKNGQLIRKHSLNLSPGGYDVTRDQSKHKAYAAEIEQAFFN